MARRIFIGYATGDEDNVRELYGALSRLEGVEAYIPEWDDSINKVFSRKIRDGLEHADLAVFLITFNSTNTIWLNQEVGYASAKNIPVISVVERGIDVKGFLEGSQHLVFQRANFRLNIRQIVSEVLGFFSKGGNPITSFKSTCPSCNKEFSEILPRMESLNEKIERGLNLSLQCKLCSATFEADPITFVAQNTG
ncbi:MAG TPA: toll/interleukin-1 receptor domain-containing protein [Candidatus Nitrosotalea sp.]|nr:toll/interleukin-1 receptor domain-containing protein [Candidatus Nitrosotalea sp.]